MKEEARFLHAIHDSPEDPLVRSVYADWLEERGDSRAEYLRLGSQLVATQLENQAGPGIRRRMIELRANLPPDWLALLGDYRASAEDPIAEGGEQVAQVLGRPVKHVDEEGYQREITAGAIQGLTGELAYIECRSQWRGSFHDINFHLHVRNRQGRKSAWEVETYNPFFGCDVQFLGWYGDVVLVIYEEKHDIYICRFGLDCPATYRTIEYPWVLDGHHLGHHGYRETQVRRLAIPSLEELPALSSEQAAEWELLPRTR